MLKGINHSDTQIAHPGRNDTSAARLINLINSFFDNDRNSFPDKSVYTEMNPYVNYIHALYDVIQDTYMSRLVTPLSAYHSNL